MKLLTLAVAVTCVFLSLGGLALAAEKQEKKLTCCQQAAAREKECQHKCCVAAHKQGKSCEKCNPNKEDLKIKKPEKKGEQKSDPARGTAKP
jgi:hypothetical protein